MNPALISACQMFLVPASILFAAVGVAKTEPLKTLLSFLGAVTSGIWVFRISKWGGLGHYDYWSALGLAVLFLVSWIVASFTHLCLWTKGSFCTRLLPSWELHKEVPPIKGQVISGFDQTDDGRRI